MMKTARADLSLRIVCCALIAILHGSAALTQPTNKVRVTLEEPCNSVAPNQITVWLTIGNETRRFKAVRDNASQPWIADWGDDKTFPADRAVASLRLKGSRTGCQRSTAGSDESGNAVAVFRFECDSAIAWQVDVSTRGEIDVDYVRTVSSDPACVEKDSFRAGSAVRQIEDVRSTGEELRLRFASTELVLLAFSASADDPQRPLFFESGEMPPRPVWNRSFKATRTATGLLELKRASIVDAVFKQALRRGQLASDFRDLVDTKLKNAGVESLFLNAGAE